MESKMANTRVLPAGSSLEARRIKGVEDVFGPTIYKTSRVSGSTPAITACARSAADVGAGNTRAGRRGQVAVLQGGTPECRIMKNSPPH